MLGGVPVLGKDVVYNRGIMNVVGGLSCPMPVRRGIRQGSFTALPSNLLCRLRSRLRGLAKTPPIVVSAYADDVNMFIQDQGDVQE